MIERRPSRWPSTTRPRCARGLNNRSASASTARVLSARSGTWSRRIIESRPARYPASSLVQSCPSRAAETKRYRSKSRLRAVLDRRTVCTSHHTRVEGAGVSTPATSGLRGRTSECAVMDDLVAAVRRGESRSLVLKGEAGIGKTALLEYLIASASDLTVVRAVGVQSDMELAFASLHQLCGPLLDTLESLPSPQRHAMEIVFGLSAGEAPDRFLVGLAVLSLFTEVSEQRPLLCVVDDAQWLDRASALTLAFVARRLLAEPVGLVFAAREPGEELRHVSEMEVSGVPNGHARALLSSAVR